MIRNARVNILRPAAPSGVDGTQTLERYRSDIRVFFRTVSGSIVNEDGEEVGTDAVMRVARVHKVQHRDVIEVVQDDDERRFRIARIEEVLAPSGKVWGQLCDLIRDRALETT